MRGYLWEDLDGEVADEFWQPHPLALAAESVPLFVGWQGWHVEGALGDMSGVRRSEKGRRRGTKSTESVRERRDRFRALGLCIECGTERHSKSKNFCARHREADRARAEKKRRERGVLEKKLPDDREGVRLHFKILVRDNEQADGTAEIREVDGYLTMNTNPDGRTLREIFVTVGKPGSSDAMYDAWAKQISNRLQSGASVEEVFRTHVGERFGDSGAVLCVRGITSCTSVPDLIARIVIARFGAKEST